MSSSSEVETDENTTELVRIIQDIVANDHCGLCGQDSEGEEYVDFCDCQIATQKIHLSCIKLLETTHNGYLRCLNRNCNNKFNQFIGDKEIFYRSRLGFEKRYPLTFFCVFLYTVIGLVQMGLFVSTANDPTPANLIPATVLHFALIIVYALLMVLLYEITARDVFVRYFRRTQATTVLQYTISCTILVSILNMLPLFTVKEVFVVSKPLAIWFLVYWACISPSIEWLVLRKNIHELREIDNLKFYLKVADIQTPTTFRSSMH